METAMSTSTVPPGRRSHPTDPASRVTEWTDREGAHDANEVASAAAKSTVPSPSSPALRTDRAHEQRRRQQQREQEEEMVGPLRDVLDTELHDTAEAAPVAASGPVDEERLPQVADDARSPPACPVKTPLAKSLRTEIQAVWLTTSWQMTS